uniref:RNA-directed RNA polymerase n=1 Tax=Leviviridae sp. TaxID=2027243 RepID=A0A514CYR4_9VIRU|nr:MAG: RNA-dependent RNA polymerase [Leviviridae sp.]
MKSLIVLWSYIADEEAMWCCTSAHRDKKTVADRTNNEGLSFLTITLPTFAKDFELSLERGRVDNDVFLSFKKNGSLPAFLQGFSCLVFDRKTGVLLDEPNIHAIRAIRQLTLLYSKILLECEDFRVAKAFNDYIECEMEVKALELSDEQNFLFTRLSRMLFASMFTSVDSDIYNLNMVPKHGPGATADKLVGNQKFNQHSWPIRLERSFPFLEMVLPNYSFWEELEDVDFHEPEAEIPVKVIAVPKTMKTPRIIAVEPTAMQYAQQAVLRLFQDGVKDNDLLNTFIGFDDQEPNQLLAKEGSLNGELATLDLSEASDRVSILHAQLLLQDHPHLMRAVSDCRSRHADVPGHGIVPLTKFASMGSALTFPIEAMTFLVVVLLGIEKSLGHPLSRRDLYDLKGRVRIFGDDIIVPKDHVHSVIDSLESFGFKVNGRKSFWNGQFRESCGREFYAGQNVSIVRVRRILPSSRRNVQEIISTVSLRNQLFLAGFESTVDLLDGRMFRILGHFPRIEEGSPVLGRRHFDCHNDDTKMVNSISLVKGWRIRPVIPVNEISGWPALRKCLSLLEQRESEFVPTSSDHLRRSGRPRAVDIKLGMGPSGL